MKRLGYEYNKRITEGLRTIAKYSKAMRFKEVKLGMSPVGWHIRFYVYVIPKDPKYRYRIERMLRGLNFEGVRTIHTYVGDVVVGYRDFYDLQES